MSRAARNGSHADDDQGLGPFGTTNEEMDRRIAALAERNGRANAVTVRQLDESERIVASEDLKREVIAAFGTKPLKLSHVLAALDGRDPQRVAAALNELTAAGELARLGGEDGAIRPSEATYARTIGRRKVARDVVFDYLVDHSPATKRTIAAKTGLLVATVASALDVLERDRRVAREGLEEGTGAGRRGVLWTLAVAAEPGEEAVEYSEEYSSPPSDARTGDVEAEQPAEAPPADAADDELASAELAIEEGCPDVGSPQGAPAHATEDEGGEPDVVPSDLDQGGSPDPDSIDLTAGVADFGASSEEEESATGDPGPTAATDLVPTGEVASDSEDLTLAWRQLQALYVHALIGQIQRSSILRDSAPPEHIYDRLERILGLQERADA